MRKREILYSDIILHRFDLLRQIETIGRARKIKVEHSWKQLISASCLENCEAVTHHLSNEQVIEALASTSDTKPEQVEATLKSLHEFIDKLNVYIYDTWKGHCRKVRSREGKKTITVEHSLLNKINSYLETCHQKKFNPITISKEEFQTAIETLLLDAERTKNKKPKIHFKK
ncbi:hypothetical protein H5187_22100 [Pseudoalteromonas sp. SG44-1]|uniref:hypothetical protein n=1 Tax=Pseudoalteromonas sp. SG44-1 TaxID=2760964 RepID=UPI001600B0B0|nr:hypothetical protein [Pseudoalteromonas sp. SG44-1]MBB1419929.1 hypothetical protein [Pseudoalteromonas sp. SG44-1]